MTTSCDATEHPARLVPAIDPDVIATTAALFRAMGDPGRLALLLELSTGPACVSDLAERLELALPALSQRLRVLRDAGLVAARRDGRHVYYTLLDAHVEQLVHNALELDLLPVREIMTPRPKVIWLSADDSHEVAWHKIVVSRHSHFPVYAGNRDHPIGVVSVKSIYANLAAGAPVNLRALAEKPVAVPETQTVVQLVETFKQAGRHVALVVDEYGGVVGMVTLHDVMEAIVGEFPGQGERARPCVMSRPDGTWLVDALVDLEAVEAALPGMRFGEEAHRDFQTLAGWLLLKFGHVPREGEACEAGGYVFEVLDMDQHRIDKVLVLERRPAPDDAPTGTPGAPSAADPDTPPPPAP